MVETPRDEERTSLDPVCATVSLPRFERSKPDPEGWARRTASVYPARSDRLMHPTKGQGSHDYGDDIEWLTRRGKITSVKRQPVVLRDICRFSFSQNASAYLLTTL